MHGERLDRAIKKWIEIPDGHAAPRPLRLDRRASYNTPPLGEAFILFLIRGGLGIFLAASI